MYVRPFAGIALLLLFSGCSIHPVPEDVTGVDTYHIVRQIRCETRKAVIDFLMRQLHRLAELDDPVARRLLLKYESDPESISSFTPGAFAGPGYSQYRNLFSVIYFSAIAYNFDLTMTEQNDLGTNVNLLGPWKPKFTLNVTGDANRLRSNQRTFTVTDTFPALIAKLNTPKESGLRYCDGQIARANYIYPIAGEIGVYKTVKTFFELVVLGGLSADKAAPGVDGPPTMVDNLKFTTTIDFSGTPKVVFTPIGTGFQLADASLTGVARRTDAHQVTVGLATTPNGEVAADALRGFVFSGLDRSRRGPGAAAPGAAKGSLFVGSSVIGTGTTSAERLAIAAVNQVKSREIQLIPPP